MSDEDNVINVVIEYETDNNPPVNIYVRTEKKKTIQAIKNLKSFQNIKFEIINKDLVELEKIDENMRQRINAYLDKLKNGETYKNFYNELENTIYGNFSNNTKYITSTILGLIKEDFTDINNINIINIIIIFLKLYFQGYMYNPIHLELNFENTGLKYIQDNAFSFLLGNLNTRDNSIFFKFTFPEYVEKFGNDVFKDETNTNLINLELNIPKNVRWLGDRLLNVNYLKITDNSETELKLPKLIYLGEDILGNSTLRTITITDTPLLNIDNVQSLELNLKPTNPRYVFMNEDFFNIYYKDHNNTQEVNFTYLFEDFFSDKRIKTKIAKEIIIPENFTSTDTRKKPNAQNLAIEIITSLTAKGLTEILKTSPINLFTNLEKLCLPKVNNIEGECFTNLTNLTHLELPRLKSIGENCFSNTRKLEYLDLSGIKKSNAEVLINKNPLIRIKPENEKKNIKFKDRHCVKLDKNDNTIFIMNFDCGVPIRKDEEYFDPKQGLKTTITKINIGREVTKINDNLFKGFKALTTVDFTQAEKLKTIGGNAFTNCNNLVNIILPNNITQVEYVKTKIINGEDVNLTPTSSGGGYRKPKLRSKKNNKKRRKNKTNKKARGGYKKLSKNTRKMNKYGKMKIKKKFSKIKK